MYTAYALTSLTSLASLVSLASLAPLAPCMNVHGVTVQVRLKSKLSQLHEVANGWAQVVLADGDSAKCSAAPLSSEELDRAFAFFDGDSYGQVRSFAVGK